MLRRQMSNERTEGRKSLHWEDYVKRGLVRLKRGCATQTGVERVGENNSIRKLKGESDIDGTQSQSRP